MRGLEADEQADLRLTNNLDESIWDAELASGDASPCVYIVEPLGELEPIPVNHVYFARTLEAATWGAELAQGTGPGRIYIIEPTGPYEDDPNLTDKKDGGFFLCQHG